MLTVVVLSGMEKKMHVQLQSTTTIHYLLNPLSTCMAAFHHLKFVISYRKGHD